MTHLGDLISAWLDGELRGNERGDAAEHLAACTECRQELAIVAAARMAVRGLPLLQPAGGVVAVPGHRPIRRVAWVSAAAASVLAAGLWIGPGQPGAAFEMDMLDQQHTARVVGDPGISTFRGEQP